MKTIYLAGGCFWGVQKFFDQFDGVVSTEVGYANGPDSAPSYQDVCNISGHAETIRIDYDEDRTGYRPDGVLFSGQSFITKLGAGISSLIQSAIFAAVGFSDRNVELTNQFLAEQHKISGAINVFATSGVVKFGGAVLDFPAYRLGMFLLISIPAAVSCVVSILPMLKYELTNEKSAEILDRLNARRALDAEKEAEQPEQTEE